MIQGRLGRVAIATKAPPGKYGSVEVCRLAKVSYRQLDYWDRTDLVNPSIKVAGGSGSFRYYSAADVARVTAIRILLDAGISLRAVRRILNGREPEKVARLLQGEIEMALDVMSGARATV